MQNIYGAKQLAASFRTVRQNTVQVAEDIPEEKYTFTPAEGARSVEQALTHIAVSTRMWQEAHASGTTKMHEYDWATAFNGGSGLRTTKLKGLLVPPRQQYIHTALPSYVVALDDRTRALKSGTILCTIS